MVDLSIFVKDSGKSECKLEHMLDLFDAYYMFAIVNTIGMA